MLQQKQNGPPPDTSKWSLYRMEQAEFDCYPQRQYYDATSQYYDVFMCDRCIENDNFEDMLTSGSGMSGERIYYDERFVPPKLSKANQAIQEARTRAIVEKFDNESIKLSNTKDRVKREHSTYDPEIKSIEHRIKFDPTGEKAKALSKLRYIAKEANTSKELMATGQWRKEAAAIINSIKGRVKIDAKYQKLLAEDIT